MGFRSQHGEIGLGSPRFFQKSMYTQNGDKMILFHCGKTCRLVPVFGIGKDGKPAPTIIPTYDGEPVTNDGEPV